MIDKSCEYPVLNELLRAAELELSAAEVHGMLTGVLCVPAAAVNGVELVLGQTEVEPSAGRRLTEVLTALSEQTRQALRDPEFGFEPLLPGDEFGPTAAAAALGEWCRGFLFGLVAAGVKDFNKIPGEAREAVVDMMQIAEVESDPQALAEDESRALTELVEYIRVGVQVVYEELQRAVH